MLDFDGMDDEARDEQDPPPSGHWTATSSYDIYMVDTAKEANGEEKAEDDPCKKQPKRRRQRAAQSPAIARAVIPAQEIITLRIVPKTTTIPSSTM